MFKSFKETASVIFASLAIAFTPGHACAYSVGTDGRLYNGAGKEIRLNGINWFGFETPEHVLHGLWASTLQGNIDLMKQQGFNAVRLPFCPATLQGSATQSIDFSKNSDLQGLNSLQVLDKVVQKLSDQGFYILLDHHRPDCQAISELWYTGSYTEAQWIADLKFVASRYKGVAGFMGVDLKNEPHGQSTWGVGNSQTDWNSAAERAAAAVLIANPDLLIFVEGIASASKCSDTRATWWGGNLSPMKCAALNIPANRLVLSPHVYGPDVYAQDYFNASTFPNNMPDIWTAQWAFAKDQGYAIVPGEFGGKYAAGSADKKWQDAFVTYLIQKNITNFFYWDWNPNSGDTGGILMDDWKTIRTDKMALLKRLMDVNTTALGGTPSPGGSTGGSTGGGTGTTTDSCAITYDASSDWGSGEVIQITLNNTGTTPITNWSLSWTVANDITVSNSWSSVISKTGLKITATPNGNATISANGSANFGLQIAYSGAKPVPSAIQLADKTCTVTVK